MMNEKIELRCIQYKKIYHILNICRNYLKYTLLRTHTLQSQAHQVAISNCIFTDVIKFSE